MRFCPWCTAQNAVDAESCAACGRRLPPLPTRKQKGGAPTGVTAPAPTPTPTPTAADDERRALRASLLPAPSARRRSPATGEVRPASAEARRRDDKTVAEPPPVTPDADNATRPIDASWLIETSGEDPDLDDAIAPPPRAAGTPTAPRRPTTAPPPIPTSPPSRVSPLPKLEPSSTSLTPPPTRVLTHDRPFIPPSVLPIPSAPEPGPINAARYSVTFLRARWQRRRAVKLLGVEIKGDTEALDVVLGTLGREARALGVDNRALAAENAGITDAEKRRDQIGTQATELATRRADEIAKFEDLERARLIKVTEAETVLADAQRELANYEAQRRGLRDKRKELERRQKAYLHAAEQRDTEAGGAPMGDNRGELRRMAEGHRREAADLDPDRQEIERKLSALDRPLGAAQANVEAAKAEVEQQRRSLNDAREGHRHRLAELDAEQGRNHREQELITAEIHRRLVTLGTLVNLHRVERPEFAELYERIDRLRQAINARTTEIDKLTAERDDYDRQGLLRGYAVLAGVVILVLTLVAVILAVT